MHFLWMLLAGQAKLGSRETHKRPQPTSASPQYSARKIDFLKQEQLTVYCYFDEHLPSMLRYRQDYSIGDMRPFVLLRAAGSSRLVESALGLVMSECHGRQTTASSVRKESVCQHETQSEPRNWTKCSAEAGRASWLFLSSFGDFLRHWKMFWQWIRPCSAAYRPLLAPLVLVGAWIRQLQLWLASLLHDLAHSQTVPCWRVGSAAQLGYRRGPSICFQIDQRHQRLLHICPYCLLMQALFGRSGWD